MEVVLTVLAIIGGVMLLAYTSMKKEEDNNNPALSEEEKHQREINLIYGQINPELICPHCQTKGKVHISIIVNREKNGISGAKATAAILTGGASLLVTGLSKKETKMSTRAFCENCKMTWFI
ncbi:MAG: hypothetical protein GXY71_07000 [Treponema sp.]|jgi:ribosomal protein L37AE/L43A|nr:hypothetical protein [Treponema sp.]